MNPWCHGSTQISMFYDTVVLEGDLCREYPLVVALRQPTTDRAALFRDAEIVDLEVHVLALDEIVEARGEGLDLVADEIGVAVDHVVAERELVRFGKGVEDGGVGAVLPSLDLKSRAPCFYPDHYAPLWALEPGDHVLQARIPFTSLGSPPAHITVQ